MEKKESENISFDSPDLTTDGCLKKRWKIINGKRCLIKGGSNPYRQQTFNEVIATKSWLGWGSNTFRIVFFGRMENRTAYAGTLSRQIPN